MTPDVMTERVYSLLARGREHLHPLVCKAIGAWVGVEVLVYCADEADAEGLRDGNARLRYVPTEDRRGVILDQLLTPAGTMARYGVVLPHEALTAMGIKWECPNTWTTKIFLMEIHHPLVDRMTVLGAVVAALHEDEVWSGMLRNYRASIRGREEHKRA